MAKAYLEDGAWKRAPDGVGFKAMGQQFLPGWLEGASQDELGAFGFVDIEENPEPTDAVVTGEILTDVDGVPVQGWATRPLEAEELKAENLVLARGEYDVRRQSPMSWDFGAIDSKDDDGVSQGPAGVQTLQMRDDDAADDLKNWLAVALAAQAYIGGGAGAAPLPLKVTANVWVQTTASQAFQVLLQGDGVQAPAFSRGKNMLARYGAIKKAIAEGQTVPEQLAARAAITTGWPS